MVFREAANAASLYYSQSMSQQTLSTDPRRPGRVRRYLPLLLWMSLIFFASTSELSASNTRLIFEPLLHWLFPHVSDERIAVAHFILRKCGHFSEYAILGFLAARAFVSSTHSALQRRWFLAALILVCIYALSDEYHQSFVPSRTASIYDSLIDIAGGLTALVLAGRWLAKRRARHLTKLGERTGLQRGRPKD
jgi:VanZ family protein